MSAAAANEIDAITGGHVTGQSHSMRAPDSGCGAAGVAFDIPPVTDIAVASVDRREVLRYLGHRGQQVDGELEVQIADSLTQVLCLARPRAALRVFAIAERTTNEATKPELHLCDSALTLVGTAVANHLAYATMVGVMVVTLGMGVERELQRRSLAGETLGQLLFDAAATAVVERAADGAEALVVDAAASRGMGVTTRFSPGYGDLPLACQATLVASVDATRRLGVTLTASDLLVPTKSVTAVVGVGPDVRRSRGEGCPSCNLYRCCAVRATGRICHG